MAVEGWDSEDSPLQLPDSGIATYALDCQLRELGGKVLKAPPKDGSYRTLDIRPFLAALLHWAVQNQRPSCSCPTENDRPVCKGDDQTEAHYLFLGSNGGHPRRSNYADDFLTPAAEGLHPKRNGVRRPVYVTTKPWPGLRHARDAPAALRLPGAALAARPSRAVREGTAIGRADPQRPPDRPRKEPQGEELRGCPV